MASQTKFTLNSKRQTHVWLAQAMWEHILDFFEAVLETLVAVQYGRNGTSRADGKHIQNDSQQACS